MGLVVSFTLVGVLVVAGGLLSALSPERLRSVASVLLVVAGITLLSSRAQALLSRLLTPTAKKADDSLHGASRYGLLGQFFTGSMLGILWSPCTGPTLGATLALGAREGPSWALALSLAAFGMGAATPILAVAYGARSLLMSRKGFLLSAASTGKKVFGVCMILVGVATLARVDKFLEARALDLLPEWITDLSVKF